jgi:hypothetical protein
MSCRREGRDAGWTVRAGGAQAKWQVPEEGPMVRFFALDCPRSMPLQTTGVSAARFAGH